MAKVIGVRFRDNGKIYYFSSEQFEVEVGQNVIVETARGVEYGRVVLGNREIHDEKIISTLNQLFELQQKMMIKYRQITRSRVKKHTVSVLKRLKNMSWK